MKNTILIITTIIILSSCGLYSKYERPDIGFTDSLYRRVSDTLDTTSIASLKWDEVFTDPDLQFWVKLGLENNTDLNVARFKVKEAQAALQSSRMAFLPGVSASIDGGTTGSVSAGFDVSWQADIFGKLSNAKKGAVAALEQSNAYRQAVQTQLIASIAGSYYSLLMLDEQLSISIRTLDNWEENIRTMEALKRAGKTNEAAVLQAKSNKLTVEGSVLNLKKQIAEMENTFSSLLGMVPMHIRRGRLEDQVFPEKLSEGIPIQLLSQRPDVRQAEQNLVEKFYMTNVARASFYPDLSLSGQLGWTNGSGAMVVNPAGIIAGVIGSLVQPVFSRGANKARLKSAIAQQEAAEYQFRQSILDAGVEVNNALMSWQTARERLKIDKKQVVTLQAAVWNTKLLMKHGLTNYLEVLTAQQNLLQAELTAISDRYQEIQGVISLYHALGGGIDSNPITE